MRNVVCPRYRECLDQAIKARVSDFDCRGCEHEALEGSLEGDDPLGYILLWVAILRPEVYAEMVRIRLLEEIRRRAERPRRGILEENQLGAVDEKKGA